MSRVVRFSAFGGPEVLEVVDVPTPQPGVGEVLIEVDAAGVNFADIAQRRNAYLYEPELPYVPGYEAAGRIVAVGGDVDDRQPGQRVLAMLPSGGYASHVLAQSGATVPLPDAVDAGASTALVVQGLTAYHVFATRAALQPGERVLVQAAAGGLGSLAVQVAKRLGAGQVIATAGSDEKLAIAQSLGADVAINYKDAPDWPAAVREATDGQGVDVILEMLGGDSVHRDLQCLAPFGRIVVVGAAAGPPEPLHPTALMGANQGLLGFFLAPILGMPELLGPSLTTLLGWLADGELRVDVTGYGLDDAASAHDDIENRRTTGKVVLTP